MTQKPNPKWHRFGQQLRRLREQAGLTQEQLAGRLNLTAAMLSAMERGSRGTKSDYLDVLDRELNTKGQIHVLWKNANKKSALPPWFEDVPSLQRQAVELKQYSPLLIPGLLQTKDYAWTTLRYGDTTATDAQIREQVEQRIKRQSLLKGDEAPSFTAIVSEAALLHPVGGGEAMSRQLDHLMDVSDTARITVQVSPMSIEQPPALDESFQLIKLPDLTEYAYTETRISGSLIDEPESVEVYTRLFGEIRGVALPPLASRDLIDKIRGDHR
jgi:transcriptional regulator with XRE-family HTH domain